MKIVGVNGIMTHGENSTDVLLRTMRQRGFETLDIRLPWRGAFTARFGGKHDGELTADHTDDGDILVAHSFGGWRSWHAHNIRNYSMIICIAPAMSRKAKWRNPERVQCFHSTSDWAILAGSLLFLHPFGSAGRYGFSQKGTRNYEMEGSGHSDYFKDRRLKVICDQIESTIKVNNGR